MPYRMKTLLFCFAAHPNSHTYLCTLQSLGDIAPLRTQPCHTLASMSSAAAATDAPEEFAALADYAVDDFMSEAASDVLEVFATTEGRHGDVSAEEIRFLARDPQAHDRVMSRVAQLPRRALRRLLCAAGFDEPVWQTRIRRATAGASLAEEVGEWYRSGAAPKRIVEAALAAHAAQDLALKAL